MEKQEARQKPLRVISPKLYDFIIAEFENYNIHSFDILLAGREGNEDIEITIRFGENFAFEKLARFPIKIIEEHGDDLAKFVKNTADKCKEVMVEEYFKMMAP